MNEVSRLSDREVTDMLRRRSARPVPVWLASSVLDSLAAERERHPARTAGRSAKRPLTLLIAATLVIGGGALAAGSGALRLPSLTAPDPRSAFEGTWVSTSDADGGTQTMTVAAGGGDVVDVVVKDTVASVCSGSPSTMTGAGSIAGDQMVVASPHYRCDGGSEPHLLNGDSTPMDAFLRNLTYRRDPGTDRLSTGNGDIWLHGSATHDQAVSYTSDDGQVSLSAPSTTWNAWLPGKPANVWFGGLWQAGGGLGGSEPSVGLVDPVAYDAWCAASGGSSLLSAPADAAAIAQQVVADRNFDATAPVAARIGGLNAISIDVALAPGGKACGIWGIEISRWIHELQGHPELRMRLFLVDLPQGMSARTLAITVKAPKDQFDAYVAETTPIIESIRFHAGPSATSPSPVP